MVYNVRFSLKKKKKKLRRLFSDRKNVLVVFLFITCQLNGIIYHLILCLCLCVVWTINWITLMDVYKRILHRFFRNIFPHFGSSTLRVICISVLAFVYFAKTVLNVTAWRVTFQVWGFPNNEELKRRPKILQ